jgi:hypothetical protein
VRPRKKIWLVGGALATCALIFFGYFGFAIWYHTKYAHQHCIKITGLAFNQYAHDHAGKLPFSTNGFGDALLLLVTSNYCEIPFICGPDDDGSIFSQALTNNSDVPEDRCSRVYIQGLSKDNDGEICILFDRNSCRGGDHFRWPWPWERRGQRVREVCILTGHMQQIRDDKWPEFSKKQVELLIAAGFSRSNALQYYPAAKD